MISKINLYIDTFTDAPLFRMISDISYNDIVIVHSSESIVRTGLKRKFLIIDLKIIISFHVKIEYVQYLVNVCLKY